MRLHRRDVLALLGTGALAGCAGLDSGDSPTETAPTRAMDSERARQLAERFAPELYYDRAETWFPTDPRPYATTRDGTRVVDGFDAVNGYARRLEEQGGPPDPMVFYNARSYRGAPLSVVQFWFYSAFDQFTTNFHWHDWEVLHVFVDDDSGQPQLYVASAHSPKVPNNEHLDPPGPPRILSELGSHSSGLSVNDEPASFQRLSVDGLDADVSNESIESLDALADLPAAYGLPRNEGLRLPYLIPELDGTPVHDHPDLPALKRSHLAPPELTVHSLSDLTSPPSGLPPRETGVVFGHGEGDHEYQLVPTAEIEDIEAFTGPQLSYGFTVPQFAENAIANHITTAVAPWTKRRYIDPVADITDVRHRTTLADRYDAISTGSPAGQLLGYVRDIVPDGSSPEDEGVTTTEPGVESVALIESEPTAVPTFHGVVAATRLQSGEHRVTVNTAGKAPYAEQVPVDESEPGIPGVDGQISLVANENAAKLQLDADAVDATLEEFSVADDFAGPLYQTQPADRDAVYVHKGGAYTAEVVDADGAVGAFRANHDLQAGGQATIDQPRTGKASLAGFVADVAEGTRRTISETAGSGENGGGKNGGGASNGVTGLLTALDAVRESAERAAEHADAGNGASADARLQAVQTRLQRVSDALATVRGTLPNASSRATDRRLQQADKRAQQARDAKKL